MQIVYFETQRDNHDGDELHSQVVSEMRALAESIEGFVRWRDVNDGLEYWGVVLFESSEATSQWKQHPEHVRIHEMTAGTLYRGFATRVFESLRENVFDG